jgi:hypothetical protein
MTWFIGFVLTIVCCFIVGYVLVLGIKFTVLGLKLPFVFIRKAENWMKVPVPVEAKNVVYLKR